jgi:hypothetical protein
MLVFLVFSRDPNADLETQSSQLFADSMLMKTEQLTSSLALILPDRLTKAFARVVVSKSI